MVFSTFTALLSDFVLYTSAWWSADAFILQQGDVQIQLPPFQLILVIFSTMGYQAQAKL